MLNSFSKIFKEYDIEYNPRPNTRYYRVGYLLNKLKENRNVPIDLYNHFHTTLSENNKAYHIIPIEKNEQIGSSRTDQAFLIFPLALLNLLLK